MNSDDKKYGFTSGGLFFKFGNDRAFRYPEIPAYVPDTAAVERLQFDLFLDSGTTSVVSVFRLKGFSTIFAAITLRACSAETVFYEVVIVAFRTYDFLVLFHATILNGYETQINNFNPLPKNHVLGPNKTMTLRPAVPANNTTGPVIWVSKNARDALEWTVSGHDKTNIPDETINRFIK